MDKHVLWGEKMNTADILKRQNELIDMVNLLAKKKLKSELRITNNQKLSSIRVNEDI